MDFKQELIDLLQENTPLDQSTILKILSIPPDPKLGDYALPCFALGGNPKEAAEKLKTHLELPEFLSKVEVVGPYVNFFLNPFILAKETLTNIYKKAKNYGGNQVKKSQKIVIEYCGPNTNKPLHLGHLRNIAIGNSMVHILSFYGHKVVPVNIINDRGVHICKSMLAYQKYGKNAEPDKKGDHFVGDWYVRYSQAEKKDESLKDEIQEMLVKWEQHDPETIKLWEKMNAWVLKGFVETYKRFGISFAKEYYESRYYSKGRAMAEAGLKSKVFKKNKDGAIYAPLEKYKLPDKVILRSDGTSIYITQDMYLAELRYHDFKFNKLIYVVATEQNNHFKQLFQILKLLKKPYAENLYHLKYGLVHLPTGRMKSREGTVIDADDVMDETANLASKEIKKRHKDIEKAELQKRAEIISLAAIKFFMTKTDPNRDIVFNPEESMSFEGETGPYVQYAHARCCAIIRKAKEHNLSVVNTINHTLFGVAEEIKLFKMLYDFPSVVEKSATDYKTHHIANYLITLAQSFNEFYHKCPVISEVRDQTKARLLLVDSVRQVLKNGLGLLGVEAPKVM
tara:strand:+ start:6773 stop:8473 length:1701 start_codon:yes stop_codon:yes gene_type:complete